jgi:hypothetical protein
MKKTLLTLLLATSTLGAFLSAQNCVRDSSLITTGALLSPAPYTDPAPNYNLATACVNTPYVQSVTVNVPTSFSGFPITNVTIAATGAVTNLPAGINYTCNPPNCVFLAGTLGCILLTGTPTGTTPAPDTLDLGINATVNTPLAPIPVSFPGQLAPGSHYYLKYYTQAGCTSSAEELPGQIARVYNTPNPFGQQTTINVEALVNGDFFFQVFDLLGRSVYEESLRLNTGANQFTFDAGQLPNGAYFYAISNPQGKIMRKMIVQR